MLEDVVLEKTAGVMDSDQAARIDFEGSDPTVLCADADAPGMELVLSTRPVCAGWVKAPAGQRQGAAVIDRLLPLPFLIPFFWPWALVVVAYDLGRDAGGASAGKRLMGLKTVMVSPDPVLDGQFCTAGRLLLRNLLCAGGRLCYFSVVLAPVGFLLDVAGCLMVCLTPEGRHLGDRLSGTRVVTAGPQGGTR